MNISGGISLNAMASNVGVSGDSVSVRDVMSVSTMRKAMDMEKQTASALLDALPEPSRGLPPNVGRNINVTA